LELAWAGDPISAFGGILCFTSEVDETVAAWLSDKFIEIIIAPSIQNRRNNCLLRKRIASIGNSYKT
jgi:phosphoribosylaminoimidazolecarboxamide formyltransferase/IMP cyclohydrolase